MSQTLYVKDKHGECPNCHQIVKVMNPPKGKYGRGGSSKLLGKKPNAKHIEILRTIILFEDAFGTKTMQRIFNNRRIILNKEPWEQCHFSTPFGNLIALGVVDWQYNVGKEHYYKTNQVQNPC